MQAKSFIVDCQTDKGTTKKTNEDAIAFSFEEDKQLFWMVIADGMGGHLAGEVASQMLVETVKKDFDNIKRPKRINWHNRIVKVLKTANSKIFQIAQSKDEYAGMGTTAVILVICEQQFFWAWVGDSRVYLWRDSKLQQLSRDHSAIHYLLDKGAITKKQAEESDSNHLLARAIGVKSKVDVDIGHQALKKDDILMLSTDGMHDFVSEKLISHYLKKFDADNLVSDILVKSAIKNDSKDNITVGIIKPESLK